MVDKLGAYSRRQCLTCGGHTHGPICGDCGSYETSPLRDRADKPRLLNTPAQLELREGPHRPGAGRQRD